jgi:hypothetical protein
MTIDISKLFASAIPDLAAQDRESGAALAQNIGKLGSGYARHLPAINRQMQTALQDQDRQQQETNARSATAAAQRVSSNASLINAQVNAYMANNPGANPQNFKVADGRIYDTAKGEWINPPSGFTKPELEKIDPDAYDTNSVVRFRQALTKATTQDEIDAAGELLLPKPDNSDYKWVKNQEEDGPEYRQSVIQGSSTWSDTVSEVRTANQANRTIRERSERIVETMDRMTESVENEEAATGIKGVALSVIPGTGNYRLSGDLETILANMGYNALQEARQNSSNGSSGFGQLTERELSRLEALIANLNQDVGVGKEAFLQRMNEIRQTFVDAGKRAKTDWTVDQWLTLENIGEPEEPELTPAQQAQRELDRRRGQ